MGRADLGCGEEEGQRKAQHVCCPPNAPDRAFQTPPIFLHGIGVLG